MAVGYLTTVLQVVETTAAIEDKAEARVEALTRLMVAAPRLPEFIHRVAIEVGVLAIKIGVTSERFKAVYNLVLGAEQTDLVSSAKRTEVMAKIKAAYPDISENAARILLELAVGQMKSKGLELG